MQWLNVGTAAYKLEGLPMMEADDFLRLAGVAERRFDAWHKADRQDETGILTENDMGEIELTADMAGISIEYNGHILTPFYMMDGAVWVETKYMAPIVAGKTEYIKFFLRQNKGANIIAVKDGLILIAVVAEFRQTEDLLEKIKLLCKQCEIRGVDGAGD